MPRRPIDHSAAMNWAQIASIPTNSATEANAAASSTTARTIESSREQRTNIVPHLFLESRQMVLGSASFSVRHYRQSGRGQTKRRREFQCYPSPMPSADAHRYLTLQFLAWAAERPRTRADVLEAWHSCPRSSIWEGWVV